MAASLSALRSPPATAILTSRCHTLRHISVPSCSPRRNAQVRRPAALSARADSRGVVASSPQAVQHASLTASSSAHWHRADSQPARRSGQATSAKYLGLTPLALEQAFHAEHPALLEALAASAAAMTPATAAQLLRHLETELPPTLTDVAPSGDCVLVAVAPGLLPLLEHAVKSCNQLLQGGCLEQAIDTAKAALCLLSQLQFGSAASAERYAAAAMLLKQALKAAYDAGAEISEEDVVELHTSCARASDRLWLTPYFGHRFACAVDDFITAGWSSAELAVSFSEAHAELIGHGRYTQGVRNYVRLMHTALKHSLSLGQVDRLMASVKRLPVEMSIAMSLMARSEPETHWYDLLLQRQRHERQLHSLQLAVAKHAANARASVALRNARHAAASAPQGEHTFQAAAIGRFA